MIGQFLKGQLDYIFFCYGLAFIFLAVICDILRGDDRQKLPWKWLGLFALTRGINEWLDMITLGYGPSPTFLSFRLGLMACSCVFLIEFGRLGMIALRGKGPGRWIFFPLFVLAGLGVFGGLTGLNISFRYALGLPGGVWAGLILLQASRKEGPNRIYLTVSGWMMLCYTMSSGVIGPKSSFFPASAVNQETFLAALGFPIQLVTALFTMVMAFAIWQLYQEACYTRFLNFTRNINYGIQLSLALAVILTAGWIATEWVGQNAKKDMNDILILQARLIAAAATPDLLKDLTGSPSDTGTPSYEKMKGLLTHLRKANQDCRFLYLVMQKDSQVVFMVDSEPSDSKDCSPAGQVYSEASPGLVGIFKSHTPIVDGPYTDRWGTWVSGFVPVQERKTKELSIALGMDVRAEAWQGEISTHRLAPMIATLLISLLLIAFFVYQQKTREAAAKISASEKQFRSLVEGSPNCILLCDDQGRFLAVNPIGLEAMSYQEQAILGKKFTQIWPATAQDEVQKAVHQVLTGEKVVFEAEYLRSDGITLFWQVHLNPIVGADGKVNQFVGVSIDITEIKVSEANLRGAIEAAEAANTAKSQFLANMSHEIRTPMNGIIGMTLLALDTELSNEQREFIEMANQSAKSLLGLVNDILDFSKVEAGKVELETIGFYPRSFVQDILNFFTPQAAAKKIRLIYDISPEVPEAVVGDPGRLRQVLNNLISNALKFTQKGHIRVHLEATHQTQNEMELHGCVQDTGMGICLEKQHQIFEPFSQADNSTTRKFGGTGLGLTISSKIVALMGGRIWVESQPGQGSSFHFTARVGRRKVKDENSEPIPVPRSEGLAAHAGFSFKPKRQLQVLLTEDNPINQKLAVQLLHKWNHDVQVAGNGLEALALLEKHEFDVILMDCQMPEMDGFEATRAIREKEKNTGQHIPIIAMTASALIGDREHCLEAGMDEYITKPISVEETFEKLESLTSSNTTTPHSS
jgi:PAS domain S-box-containing protein